MNTDELPTAMPPLRIERLLIRPLTPADLEAVHRILDVELGEALSREERDERLQWTAGRTHLLASLDQPPYGDRALVRLSDNALVGLCGLVPSLAPFGLLPSFPDIPPDQRHLKQPEVGLYYALSPSERGKGYATEAAGALIRFAFEAMEVRRVVATTTNDNEASRAVMRRLGMRLEQNPEPEPPWFQWCGVIDNPSLSRS